MAVFFVKLVEGLMNSMTKGYKMKSNRLIVSVIAVAALFVLNACASYHTGTFRDDVYHPQAQAVEKPYQSPDYYYDADDAAGRDDGYYAD